MTAELLRNSHSLQLRVHRWYVDSVCYLKRAVTSKKRNCWYIQTSTSLMTMLLMPWYQTPKSRYNNMLTGTIVYIYPLKWQFSRNTESSIGLRQLDIMRPLTRISKRHSQKSQHSFVRAAVAPAWTPQIAARAATMWLWATASRLQLVATCSFDVLCLLAGNQTQSLFPHNRCSSEVRSSSCASCCSHFSKYTAPYRPQSNSN